MSNRHALRGQIWLIEKPRRYHPGALLLVALLILAVAAGLAEIHLLPTFSADDFGSILFGAG